ncbi:peptidylprolyl isomerase [Colwellia sp. MB3u-70]|nr:peptidylprolyl isomerase [Colwellia sp. MB3u-8]MBA6308704.1 peptidylprolyl isomerase [Colwellia sp. MB3u-70]
MSFSQDDSALIKSIYFTLAIISYNNAINPKLENNVAAACARHILVKSEKLAQELKAKIAKGADFGQLAKKNSTCPSGKKGGDLGEFKPGQMVKAFDDVVFKKAILTVHGPIKTKFGYHLIQTIYRN